jgi:hypothetical protein
MNDFEKVLLKEFLMEEDTEENNEDVTNSEYEKIIDALGNFLAELDPDSLSESAQASLLVLYENLSEVYDLDDIEDEEESEEDDSLVEYKVRRISRSKHRAAHKKYLMMKRKKGSKMKMKAKLARKTAKYKAWAKRYKKKKKAGRTGKIRLV